MSDNIELVIKISKETCNDIKDGFYNENLRAMAIAIGDGTPLPEGHGKLFDYYDAVELINNKADEENCNFSINDVEKFGALLREVNPIIEADKESEDKEYET